MIKYILIALLLALVGSGIWFWNKSDPQKLDFADRWAPGESEHGEAPVTAIAYGTDDRQKLDIYAPEGDALAPYPVLIFFHGGAWRDGEREGYGFLGRAFASRGFVTVIADYRKSPQVRFPAFVDDTAAAIAWVHSNVGKYQGNTDRIFLMGHSAGAHIAMMTALDPRYLKAQGLGIFLIEHDIHNVMKLCDRAVVMKNGQRVGTVNVNDVTDDDILGMIIMGKKPAQAV